MKKYIPYIIAAIVVVGGVGAYIASNNKDAKKSDNQVAKDNSSEATLSFKYKDACKLFTPEQISSALGGTFGPGEEDIAVNTAMPGSANYEKLKGSACKFDQKDDGTIASIQKSLRFSVAINNYESADKAKASMDDLRSPKTAEGQEVMGDVVDVKGVGDQAFFPHTKTGQDNIDGKSEALHVRFNNQIIVLRITQMSGIDRTTAQANLTTIAKEIK